MIDELARFTRRSPARSASSRRRLMDLLARPALLLLRFVKFEWPKAARLIGDRRMLAVAPFVSLCFVSAQLDSDSIQQAHASSTNSAALSSALKVCGLGRTQHSDDDEIIFSPQTMTHWSLHWWSSPTGGAPLGTHSEQGEATDDGVCVSAVVTVSRAPRRRTRLEGLRRRRR